MASVAAVAILTPDAESDVKKRYILAGAALIACTYGTGIVHDRHFATAIAVAGGVLLAGGLVGAGHARERRAWHDYQDARARVPAARRAWFEAARESAARYAIPAALLVGAVVWWRGQR